jgi:hypothetical protein
MLVFVDSYFFLSVSNIVARESSLPCIKCLDGFVAICIEDSKQMSKYCLSHPKLELMHKLWHKHGVKIEPKA